MQIKSVAKHYIKYIKKSWITFSLWTLGVIGANTLNVIIPVFFKDVINGLTTKAEVSTLINLIIIILILYIIRWFFWRTAEFHNTLFLVKAMRTMYDDAYNYLLKHSYNFFINQFTGSLTTKLQKLVVGFETVLNKIIWNISSLVIQITFILIILSTINTLLTILLAIWVVVFLIVSTLLMKYKVKLQNKVNEIDVISSGFASDTISNYFNIITFANHKEEIIKNKKISDIWEKAAKKVWHFENIINAIQDILMVTIEFIIFYYGIKLWHKGLITVGEFVLLQSYLIIIFNAVWDFGRYIRELGDGISKSAQMIEILEKKPEIKDIKNAKNISIKNGEIKIKNLDFKYKTGDAVFKNFNLTIKPKEKIALVSKSGEGKTTLTKLILRLYDIQKGEILIDGQNISKVTQKSLREQISLVPQDPILFHRTIKENIAYGKKDATMEEIIEASKKAHSHEFITKLEHGYDTLVGERGVKLSGGERQRIAIARAILKNAPILILDEATSSLDSHSELLIQEALKELMKNKTAIVIAHRLSTISAMDRIIVLEKGKIIEEGTHNELIKKEHSKYKLLWEIQSKSFTK